MRKISKKKYCVYEWYVVPTKEVFYVGSCGTDRYKIGNKDRSERFNKYYNNFNCNYRVVEWFDSLEEAQNKEIELIALYKSKGLAKANRHIGGSSGGATMYYATPQEIQNFKEKMTQINKERTNTSEFKENARKRMIKKFSNPEEREAQSLKVKEAWNNKELREKHSKIIKNSYTKELREVRAETMREPVIARLRGEEKKFESKKSLYSYFKDNYNFNPCRSTWLKLFEGEEYKPYHKRFQNLAGLKIEVIDKEV